MITQGYQRKIVCHNAWLEDFKDMRLKHFNRELNKSELRTILIEIAIENGIKILLVHALDGVIWGRIKKNDLFLSCDIETGNDHHSPEFRWSTITQLRMFSDKSELFLRRTSNRHVITRFISENEKDTEPDYRMTMSEDYLLWGNYAEPVDSVFSRLEDRRKGFVHFAPVTTDNQITVRAEKSIPVIGVRHYVKEDRSGFFDVAATRLMNVRFKEKANE